MKQEIRVLNDFNDADDLSRRLLALAEDHPVCILDSCGAGYQKSRYLIAGIADRTEICQPRTPVDVTLSAIDDMESDSGGFDFFTLSYDFGRSLELGSSPSFAGKQTEPDFFRAQCRAVVIHDYIAKKSFLAGNAAGLERLYGQIAAARPSEVAAMAPATSVSSNFSRGEYLDLIEQIRESIRRGTTYQTNLTQCLSAQATESAAQVFLRIRKTHPAAFSAYLDRRTSKVVSASPELFILITHDERGREIRSSPIKGTRQRGVDSLRDAALREELLNSEKDRAENIMIVDLIRNDFGRVCEFGSVTVDNICEIETHPTLFHLVSTVRGRLRSDMRLSGIIRATFPCGSITGAPKISTMKIIDRLETANRGLSMGAIGFCGPNIGEVINGRVVRTRDIQMSVAIRTMTLSDGNWRFNVGGGVVIDSDPDSEYEESLTKARALLGAIGGVFSGNKSNPAESKNAEDRV